MLAGCANRGNPRPPSLHLPEIAANLKAERIADRVLLTWTTSDKTSDGLILHAPITAVICRDAATRVAAKPALCTPVSRFAVAGGQNGQSHASDTLPPALLADPPQLLAYRMELLNPKNRSAGLSAPAFAASGSAPADPGPIRITATRRGAIVEWTPVDSSAAMELTRALTDDAHEAVSSSPPKPRRPNTSLPASKPKDPKTPVLLRAGQPNAADTGGLLDPMVLPHTTYSYMAQRVRTVQLEGHSYELRSAPSAAVSFSYQDVFPPPAPSGLESIASAPVSEAGSIDLSWEAGAETDILGYNIYRADSASGEFKRLSSAPVASPSFRDKSAQAGHTYWYRITAVDRSGNESAPSAEIRDSLPDQR